MPLKRTSGPDRPAYRLPNNRWFIESPMISSGIKSAVIARSELEAFAARNGFQRIIAISLSEAKLVMDETCEDCIKNLRGANTGNRKTVWYDREDRHLLSNEDKHWKETRGW